MSLVRASYAIVFLVCLAQITGSEGVKIKNLSVPAAVPSNSESPIILDCDYTVEEDWEDGLVVKWYFNDNPNPVYQWIVGRKPTVYGVFKKSVNNEYKISEEREKMYRAVKIEALSKELSGVYRCDVSTPVNEASESKKMIVYTPAKSLDLSHKVDGDQLTIECVGSGVFPEPNMTISTNERLKTPNLPVEIERVSKEGLYDIHAKLQLSIKDLPEQITFNCFLNVPETNYTLQKSTSIYPRQDGSSGSWSASPLLYTILMSLILTIRL